MKTIRMTSSAARAFLLLFAILTVIAVFSLAVPAQNEAPADMKKRALQLMDEQKMTDALPLLEKLGQLTPNDDVVQLNLGFALLGQAANTPAGPIRRELRVRARAAFGRAQSLGNDSQLVKGLVNGLPMDGADPSGFSDNAEANKLMEKGEAGFSSGKLDEALSNYQAALKIDPLCYFAAVFSGDVYMQQEKFDNAETWYLKAVEIDPFRETAYRYSATPLMKQGKYQQARDRYIEAFIVDPYGRLSLSGIIGWGETTKTRLGHPKIDIPEITIGPDGKATSTLSVTPSDDGSLAWASYVTTRENWRKEKFAKAYPDEKEYRHSLQEEVEALRTVISTAHSLKPKALNGQIAMLEKLDKDGVLEAYILLAIPDRGIAQEHPAYLRKNRDRLRKYVLNYVIQTDSANGSVPSVKGFVDEAL